MTEADLNLDVVMSRRFDLVAQQEMLAARHKAELAPLAEEIALCETFIKDAMNQSGAQSFKSASTGDMAFFTTKDSVTVQDMPAIIRFMVAAAPPLEQNGKIVPSEQWQAVVDHICQHGMWGLLNKAVNKSAAKELIEAQTPPPGIKYDAYKDLAWRRGKGAA